MNELMLAEVPEYVMCYAIDTGNTDDLLLSESMTQRFTAIRVGKIAYSCCYVSV